MNFLKKNSTIFSFIFAILAFIGTSMTTSAYVYYIKYFTNNIYMYIAVLGYYLICKKSIEILNKRLAKYSLIFSILLTLAFVIGYNLHVYQNFYVEFTFVAFIALFPILFLLSALAINYIDILKNKITNLKYSKKTIL